MKISILFFCVVVSLYSCKKESTANRKLESIVYKNFNPRISLTSIDSVEESEYCNFSYNKAYPSSDTVYYDLDMDLDKISDFRISVSHYITICNWPKCGEWETYICLFSLKSLKKGDSVFVDLKINHGHPIFKINDTIIFKSENATQEWVSLISGGCPPSCPENLNDAYLGVKINNNSGWIHFAQIDKSIQIIDYAINMTEGNSIIVGRTK